MSFEKKRKHEVQDTMGYILTNEELEVMMQSMQQMKVQVEDLTNNYNNLKNGQNSKKKPGPKSPHAYNLFLAERLRTMSDKYEHRTKVSMIAKEWNDEKKQFHDIYIDNTNVTGIKRGELNKQITTAFCNFMIKTYNLC
jgi:hypothetical protein